MTGDLALIAGRRGGLAALLGLLLLEEPGPALGDLVADLPALAPLASGGPELATEYERVFLRGVPLYESVFRSDDGQQGGAPLTAVVERYERLGYGEHTDRRWRIAGADHLGLELRCLAQLCGDEAEAWRADTPDRAVSAVEAERALLADHLAAWAPVALGAAAQVAADGPYRAVLDAASTFLDEECERLRPAPAFGPDPGLLPLPAHLGPARLARLLLAPATSGTWLATDVIAGAARSIGAPWRPSDNRTALRHVIEAAADTNELPQVLEPLLGALRSAADAHRDTAGRSPGNAANARAWAARADAMGDRLGRVAAHGLRPGGPARAAEVLSISGTDAARLADAVDAIVEQLRSTGFTVERHGGAAPGR